MTTKVQQPEVKNIVIGLGIILLIIAGIFYFKSKKTDQVVSSPNPEEIIVQQEGAVKKTGGLVQPLTEEEIKQIQQEVNSVLSVGGEKVNLKDVVGGGASGNAQRAFSDGKFYYKLTATNLKFLDKGYYYEGWLMKDKEVLSTGRVEVASTGIGGLYYTASADKSDYNKVVVTIQPENGNPTPATHILEGEF